MISHFGLMFSSHCSTFSKILVCSQFAPFCFPSDHFLQPCRELYQEVKASCIHHFKKLETPWPAALNCSTLPSSPNLSFSISAKYACVSASVCYVFYWSAICFQSAIPTSSFVLLVNQSNCLLNASKFHVRFKFHACYFIALNSSSALQAYCHTSIRITRTYFRYFFIVCSFYFISAFGFVFIITPLLSAIPTTHS